MECTVEGLHSSGSFTMFSAPIKVFLFEVCWLSLIIPLVNFSVTSLCTALTHLAYQRVSCDEVFMLIWAEGWASATCQNLLDVMLIWTEGWASTSCRSLLDASQKARSLLPPPSTLVFYYFLLLRLWPGPVKPGWGIWEEIPVARQHKAVLLRVQSRTSYGEPTPAATSSCYLPMDLCRGMMSVCVWSPALWKMLVQL